VTTGPTGWRQQHAPGSGPMHRTTSCELPAAYVQCFRDCIGYAVLALILHFRPEQQRHNNCISLMKRMTRHRIVLDSSWHLSLAEPMITLHLQHRLVNIVF
jgi:hypothetical protein